MFGVLRARRGRRWFAALTLVGVLAVFGLATAPTAPATSMKSPTIHLGDLDGTITGSTAIVTITAHDARERPVGSAYVSGDFFSGAIYVARVNCATGSFGTCTVYASLPPNTNEVTFTVWAVGFAGTYDAAANHDPDGDSDGTTITVFKP